MAQRANRHSVTPMGDGLGVLRLGEWGRSILSALAALTIILISPGLGASNLVEYVYDAAGNIVQIKRQTTTGIAITSVDPGSAAVGTAVTVFGTGFSASPVNNTVKFNGVSATVSEAATGSLAVVVPAGATTGRVTVTVGASTATSPFDFVVTIPGAPTIASFSPGSGDAGAVVSVTGTNFDPSAAVTVKLNTAPATATVASSTSLSFTVPAAAGSGRILVTNPTGTGMSVQDFIVPPPSVPAGDIVASLRVSEGAAPANLSVYSQYKHGVVLFDGSQDGYYTLQFSNWASSPSNLAIAYKIYKPDNTLLATGSLGSSNRPTIHLPRLPASGTYVALLSPGAATLSANVQLVNDPVLTIDGAPVAFALNGQSQSARMQFQANAGQRIGLGVMGLSLAPTWSSGSGFQVFKPDGTALNGSSEATCYVATAGNPQANCDGEFVASVTGVYTILAQPVLGTTASFSVRLSSEATGALALDVPLTTTLARVGQDARFTVPISGGDSVAIALNVLAPQPQMQAFAAYVYRPDGTQLTSASSSTTTGSALIHLGTVAASGTYTIFVDPSYGAYGDFTLTGKSGPLVTTTDSPSAFAGTFANEPVRLRFNGTAGQNLAVAIDSLVHTPASGSSTTVAIHRPDGTQLTYDNCYTSTAGGRCKLTLSSLASTGVYSIVITPPTGSRASGNLTISSDQTGALSPDVAAVLSVTRAGQNVRYTFDGAPGDYIGIELANLVTNPAGRTVYLYVYKPNGALLTSTSTTAIGTLLNLYSLPSAGTYTVLVDSTYGVPWDGRLKVKPGPLMAVDGGSQSLATAYPGEMPRFRFAGTAGQRIDLGIAGLAYGGASSSQTNVSLYRPDGTYVSGIGLYPTNPGGGGDTSVASLPTTGIYTAVVNQPMGITIAAGALSVSTPVAGSLTIGVGSQTIAVARPGQTARYTFSGTAAQLLRLNWSAATVSGTAAVAVSVLKPDGTTLTTASFGNGAAGGVDIAPLPATGTYTVIFDPGYAATMTADVALVTR